MKEETFKENLESVIGGILEVAQKERESSEPYKNLFKRTEGKTLDFSLHEIERDMVGSVLNATSILKKQGYKVTNEGYDFLLALPILAQKLEEDIRQKDGFSCCVDKTYHLLRREFEKLITPTPHTNQIG